MRRATWLVALVGVVGLAGAPAWAQEGGDDEGGEGDLPPMLKNPRMVSGQARPEQQDPPRQLTVRVVQGAMRRTEFGDVVGDFPPGVPVHLVGVDRTGAVSIQTRKVDKGGRAVFDKLVTDGSVSYYALALLPRKGATDRVQSRPVTMPPEVGMRMMLAGHAVDSDKAAIDEVLGDDAGEDSPAAGEVTIDLDGQTDGIEAVELVQAGVDKPIGRAPVEPSKRVIRPQGRVKAPAPDPALRDGVIDVVVKRKGEGVAGIDIAVVTVEGGATEKDGKTDGEGRAVFSELAGGHKYKLRATLHGQALESPAFESPAKGGLRIAIEVNWQEVESLRAHFHGIASGGDKAYVARAVGSERPSLSPPFQMTDARGAASQIIVFPNVLIGFHGGTNLDDDKLWFEIQFTVLNPSTVPYDAGPSGLRIPLPRGFIGASVRDEMAARVKVDEDRGLVWRGAIPPGQRTFIASFALLTEGGKVAVEMDLPNGAVQSQLVLEDIPGVRIDVPAGVHRETRTQQGRKFVMLAGIERRPGEQLTFKVAGLPQAPAWRSWTRRGVGLGVLALLAWAIVAVARGRRVRTRTEELEAQREELLQALTQLEADLQRKKLAAPLYRKQKAALASKLEAVYAELGAAESARSEAP